MHQAVITETVITGLIFPNNAGKWQTEMLLRQSVNKDSGSGDEWCTNSLLSSLSKAVTVRRIKHLNAVRSCWLFDEWLTRLSSAQTARLGFDSCISSYITLYQPVNYTCVCVLLQVGPCGEVRAYIMALWGVRDLSPTCGDPHKE